MDMATYQYIPPAAETDPRDPLSLQDPNAYLLTARDNSTSLSTSRFRESLPVPADFCMTTRGAPDKSKAMVLDMLKKRKELRRNGGVTDRPVQRETPQSIVTKKLQEIEDITHSRLGPSTPSVSQLASCAPMNTSVSYIYNQSHYTPRESLARPSSAHKENSSSTLSARPPSGQSFRRPNVFDRLISDAKCKQIEGKMYASPGSRPGSARKQYEHHHQQSSCDSGSVEDRLIRSRQDRESRLCKQRAQRQAEELSCMRSSPMISPNSSALARSRSGAYSSILKRFQALEDARLKHKIMLTREKIDTELEGVTGVPQVPLIR